MRVRKKRVGAQSPIIKARTNQTLDHAMRVLENSIISPYIAHVYIYGSCARQEQTYDSDVDLIVELFNHPEIEKYKDEIIKLKGSISPVSLDLPAVDLHVVIGDRWKNDRLLYYQNIKKEGIDIWAME